MPRVWKIFTPCSVETYQDALLEVRKRMSDAQLRMLQTQYAAPNRTVTAPQLVRAVGYTRYSVANLHYGRLGRFISEATGRAPSTRQNKSSRWWSVLSDGIDDSTGFHWVMHPQLAEALEKLSWVSPVEFTLPEEVTETTEFFEGAVRQVQVNAYERNREARQACIDFYGTSCSICTFDFAEVYGVVGEGFIHVHHERPLAEIGEAYRVDPVEDLKPVCPNCHAMVHRRTPPYSIGDMKKLLSSGAI